MDNNGGEWILITLQTWQGWRARRRRWSRRRRCRSTRRGREGAWRRKAQEAASLASWDENIWNAAFSVAVMLAKRKQHQPVKDADAKSHERVREVNGLLPLVGDRQIRDRQVCLLKQKKLSQMFRMSKSRVSKCQNMWSTDLRSPGLPSETEQAASNVSNVWIRSFQMSKSSYIQLYRSLCRDWKEHSGIYR